MKKSTLLTALALGLLVLAGLILQRHFSGSAMNLRPSGAVGEVLAAQANRLLAGNGGLVIIGRSSVKERRNSTGEQMAAFTAAMKRLKTPGIAATEWLPSPPPRAMDTGKITDEQLLQVLAKYPQAKVLVLFAGLPPLSPAVAEALSARSVKLLAVCGYGMHVRRWLETQTLSAAIIPRFGELPPGTPAPKTPMDWFQQEFEMVTPESVERLPY